MDFTRADYEADIKEYFKSDIEPYIPPKADEFTVDQFVELMAETGASIGRSAAALLLNEKVESGELTVRPLIEGRGQPKYVYRRVKHE